MSTDSPSSSRRRALRVIAVGCLATPALMRAALAEARAAHKPLLTARRLNRSLPKPDAAEYDEVLKALRGDLRGWLAKNFHMPARTQNKFERLGKEDLVALGEAFEAARAKRLPVTVVHTPADAAFSLTPVLEADKLVIVASG